MSPKGRDAGWKSVSDRMVGTLLDAESVPDDLGGAVAVVACPNAISPTVARLTAAYQSHQRFGVQVRKIAIRITMTAIAETKYFVIVTNV